LFKKLKNINVGITKMIKNKVILKKTVIY